MTKYWRQTNLYSMLQRIIGKQNKIKIIAIIYKDSDPNSIVQIKWQNCHPKTYTLFGNNSKYYCYILLKYSLSMRAKSANPLLPRKPLSASTSNLHRAHIHTSSLVRRSKAPQQQSQLPDHIDLIRFQPQKVTFEEIKSNTIYKTELLLRNLSTCSKKIRIIPPATNNFKIEYDPTNSIASGLALKINVLFKAKQQTDCFDNIIIYIEQSKKVIPLEAFTSKPRINFDPLPELNHLKLNHMQEFRIKFYNDGIEGNVSLRKEPSSNISISPEYFRIGKNQIQIVKVSVQPRQVGIQRHTIEILVNQHIIDKVLDIIYTAFEYHQYILNEDGYKCKQLKFPSMYLGQKQQLKCKLYNNTPNRTDCKIKVQSGSHDMAENFIRHQTPQEIGKEQTEKIIDIRKTKQSMEPFEHQDITIVCNPEITEQHRNKVIKYARSTLKNHSNNIRAINVINKYKIEKQEFDYTLMVQLNEQTIYCSITGSCVLPTIKLSEIQMNFDTVKIHQKEQKVLYIENNNKQLAIEVSFPKISSVEITPQKTVIMPLTKATFEVAFCGASLGIFNKEQQIILANLYSIPFPIRAQVISPASNNRTSQSIHTKHELQQLLTYNLTKINKNAYNRILSAQRQNRLELQRVKSSQQLLRKHLLLQATVPNDDQQFHQKRNQTKEQDQSKSLDVFFESKLNPTCSSSSKLTLPTEKQGLFVIRPIDKYQPFKKSVAYKKKLKDEDFISVKRSQPKHQKQANDIKVQLTGQMLKYIKTNTSLINFGKLFINSVAKHPFFIINELITSIQVRLQSDHPDLELIDKTRQIIGSTQKAKFDIIVKTSNLGQLKLPVKYIINEIHVFELLVFADVELVNLGVTKNNIKMVFSEQNYTMEIIETIMLKNNGNSPATFSVSNTKKCTFVPNNGTIKQKSQQPLTIKFRPISTMILAAGQPKNLKDFPKSSYNSSDEKIPIKITDGLDIPLRIQSNIPQVKCYIKQSELNFGKVVISKEVSRFFTIKNTSRISAVFEIDLSQVGDCCKVDTLKGKIPSEGSKDITIRFKSDREYELKAKLLVNIRASSTIHLPLFGRSTIPNVVVVEPNFNFGAITALSTAILPMTIWNKSQMTVELIIDMAVGITGVQCLQIQQIKQERNSNSWIESKKELLTPTNTSFKKIKITIEENQRKCFKLKYTPSAVKNYMFELPLFLENYIKTKNITRMVTCQATEAMFLVEPSLVKFKKKIILEAQKSIPSLEFITLKNPHNKPVNWKFGDEIKQNKIFFMRPFEGILQGQKEIKIKVSFAPLDKGVFKIKLPLYIFNDEKAQYHKYSEVTLEGEGDEPKLFFDKKEIILMPVPLQIQSKAIFRIYNQGYQNMGIKHRLDVSQQSNIQIGLSFPEGTKVGINKTQILVVVTFMSKKSISFLIKLEILDSNGKVYSIPVSGTADNSVMTVFPYLNNNIISYGIQKIDNKILLTEPVEGTKVEKLVNFTLPNKEQYDFPREFIKKWLKFILNDQKISTFPESIIDRNGQQFFKLIHVLTGGKKQFQKPVALQTPLEIYNFLLKTLKMYGCLINHIRPYYLLNEAQYEVELKNDCYLKNKIALTTKYWYVSYESWIILFYQIIYVFGYQIKLKNIAQKMITQTTSGKQTPLDKEIISNVYSTSQICILRWVQFVWQQYSDHKRRFLHFKNDFADGVAIIYLVYHYIPNKNKQLQGIYKNPINNNQILSNLKKISALLSQIGLTIFVGQEDILKFTQKQYLLYLIYLYNTLPHYIPKAAPLIFSCHLGDEITKYIDIYNPSNKPISYWVKIDGSNDFKVDDKQSIKIDPKKTYKFKISFVSRISEPIQAFLVLTNKRETTVSGAALVFQLKSEILGRKSIKKLQPIRSALYELTSIRVNVQNKFEQYDYGDFQIYLIEEKQFDKSEKKPIAQTQNTIKSRKHTEKNQTTSFFCDAQRIKLKRMSAGVIDISFLPLNLEIVKCYIIFIDPIVGEFQYQIKGIPQLPKPLLEVRPQTIIYVDQRQVIQLNLPLINTYMQKAKTVIQQRIAKTKDFMIFGQPEARQIYPTQSATFTIQTSMQQNLSKFIKIPTTIILASSKRTNYDENQNNVANKLKFQICFEFQVKDFVLDLVLTNQSKTDVRRFKVYLNILPKPLKLFLEMKAPSRGQVIQNIPIYNTSDKDWKFRVSLITEKPEFSLRLSDKLNPKELICKRGSQLIIPFCFAPNWICELEAKLIIANTTTNQLVEYEVKGIGEQPLSQNHISVKCKLKQVQTVNLAICNPFATAHIFKVETDLVNCYGATSMYLGPNKKSTYSLTINPLISGNYTGALFFYDDTGRYFWYTMTIETQEQAIDTYVQLNTYVRRAIEVDLQIFNSLDEIAYFQVEIRGDDLYGENKLLIDAKSSAIYTLVFKPEKIYEGTGRISFINQKLGQKIYDLRLISTEQTIQKLQPIKCELGEEQETKIQIRNTLNKKIEFQQKISNPHFRIELKPLQPYQNAQFSVFYKPVNAGIEESCQLEISSEDFGKLKYTLLGFGQYPSKIVEISIDCKVDETITNSIKFTNPFDHPINLNISLAEQNNAFNLIKGNKHKITLPTGMNIQIPYTFKPKQVRNYTSNICLSVNQKINWRYHLVGNIEVSTSKESYTFTTTARQAFTKYIEVRLDEIKSLLTNQDTFSYKILYPAQYERILKKYLDVKLSNNLLTSQNNNPLRFLVNFKPEKPLKTSVDLHVLRSSGGKFKIKIYLEGTRPPIDQIIQIMSRNNRPTTISFPVPHHYAQSKKYAAYIDNNNPNFEISPKVGLLQSTKSLQQTKITITFTPSQTFKNVHLGKLIIQTDDYFWSYELRGQLPVYKAPEGESKISTHWHAEQNHTNSMIQGNKAKNFLLQNLNMKYNKHPQQASKR